MRKRAYVNRETGELVPVSRFTSRRKAGKLKPAQKLRSWPSWQLPKEKRPAVDPELLPPSKREKRERIMPAWMKGTPPKTGHKPRPQYAGSVPGKSAQAPVKKSGSRFSRSLSAFLFGYNEGAKNSKPKKTKPRKKTVSRFGSSAVRGFAKNYARSAARSFGRSASRTVFGNFRWI